MLDILALLLDGGGSLTQALRFMKEACVNDQEHEALKQVQRLIVEGASLGSALREAEFFPPLIVSLLEVGDETGQLERMAQRSAEICEEDVRHAVDSAMTVLEPVLLAIAGFIAGLAIITSVMPMLSLLQGL
jgi:type IV pilus assembly protein PilC